MNIYQLEQSLLNIFDIIEENDGEITPELEKELEITQEEFKDKVKNYTDVIKLLTDDINNIKAEQKRLKDFADKKQKTITRLSEIIINAIEKFGDVKRSGVHYLDYGTGEISIRSTKAVDVDTNLLKELSNAITLTATDARFTNQLDAADRLNPETIMAFMTAKAEDDEDAEHSIDNISEADLRHTNVELSVKVPLSELLDGDAYPIIREIAKHTQVFDVNASVSKTNLKKELEENGSCAPNLAKLVVNKSINIK